MTLEGLLNSKKHDELDTDNMDGKDFMKNGAPVGCLIQSGLNICLPVVEVMGFRLAKRRLQRQQQKWMILKMQTNKSK